MSKPIDLVAYRAELQRKIAAIDVILGRGGAIVASSASQGGRVSTFGGPRRKMSAAAKARLAAIARARWRAAKQSGKKHL